MANLVDFRLDESIATITMDDGKVNVLSVGMQREVHAALDHAEAEGAVVVLRGRPGVFSAGFDLPVLQAGGTDAVEMVRGGFELSARLLSFPYPVVIACTGHAIAMGVFLLLSGDHRVGGDHSYKITANEVAIGLTMPHAATEILRQRLTPAAFDRAVMLAEMFAPQAALEAGFLDRLVAPDDVDTTARTVAEAARGLDLRAHAASKLRARAGTLAALRAAIDADAAEFAHALTGAA